MPPRQEPKTSFGDLAPEPQPESEREPVTRAANQPDGAPSRRLRVWDLPTRLFHWALALAVIGQLVTGFGGWLDLHMRIGLLVLALLSFRLVWGFVGGRWSRFAAFIYSPASVIAYLKGESEPAHTFGHNPLGSLSVFALLTLLSLQVASGLFADDEVATTGPLARFVSNATTSLSTSWHAVWGKWIVIALVSLHVVAICYYVFARRERLVAPMLSGDKSAPQGLEPSRDDAYSRLGALGVFLVCAAFAVWIASF